MNTVENFAKSFAKQLNTKNIVLTSSQLNSICVDYCKDFTNFSKSEVQEFVSIVKSNVASVTEDLKQIA